MTVLAFSDLPVIHRWRHRGVRSLENYFTIGMIDGQYEMKLVPFGLLANMKWLGDLEQSAAGALFPSRMIFSFCVEELSIAEILKGIFIRQLDEDHLEDFHSARVYLRRQYLGYTINDLLRGKLSTFAQI